MREILFRGKRIDNGEWVEGYYVKAVHHWHKHGIHEDWIITDASANGGWFAIHNRHAVDPETIGQYTGLDANGRKIFEGDIVIIQNDTPFEMTGEVVFDGGCFELHDPECDMYECLWYEPKEMTVLGKIHDNPELLEGGNT